MTIGYASRKVGLQSEMIPGPVEHRSITHWQHTFIGVMVRKFCSLPSY